MFEDIDIAFDKLGDMSFMVIIDRKSNSRYSVCAYPKSEKAYCLEEIKITLEKIEQNRNKNG